MSGLGEGGNYGLLLLTVLAYILLFFVCLQVRIGLGRQ